MTTLGNCALPIFLWSIAAVWVADSPVQAGQSETKRNQYGLTAAETTAAYLEDHDALDKDDPNDIVGIRGPLDQLRDIARTSDFTRRLSLPSKWIHSTPTARRIPLLTMKLAAQFDEIDRTIFDDLYNSSTISGQDSSREE